MNNAHAAGIIMRVQQMKAQRQHTPPPGMTPEQYHEYEEQQRGDHEPQAPAKPTYQQTVDKRNQAIAQAILQAHNPSISSEDLGTISNPVSSMAYNQGPAPTTEPLPPSSTDAKDVVDLTEVWKKLDTKSTVWTLLIEDQAKVLTVSEYLDRFHKLGVKINEPPAHYVQMIDQIAQGNPQMLQRPFGELIQILAIVDYDFDNGMDKDVLARKVLGDAGFEANKKRFSQQSSQ